MVECRMAMSIQASHVSFDECYCFLRKPACICDELWGKPLFSCRNRIDLSFKYLSHSCMDSDLMACCNQRGLGRDPKHLTVKDKIQPAECGRASVLSSAHSWGTQVEQDMEGDILSWSKRTWFLICLPAVWTWSPKTTVCEGGGSCCPHQLLGRSIEGVICAVSSLWTLSSINP